MNMRIDEITQNSYLWLNIAEQAFASLNIPYVAPYKATVKQLHEGTVGRHRGLYLIHSAATPPVFYYLWLAKSPTATISGRFQPHYAKLTVNLPKLYGGLVPKKETQWQFPRNWRKGVRQHFLDNPEDIPDYWKGRQKHDVIEPINHDWKPQWKAGVAVDSLPVLAWDLSALEPKQIDDLETAMIRGFKPVFNGSKTQI